MIRTFKYPLKLNQQEAVGLEGIRLACQRLYMGRDHNAALNILARGLRAVEGTLAKAGVPAEA